MVWERHSHGGNGVPTPNKKERLHQTVQIKWAFANKNFDTGSPFHCRLFTSSGNLRVASTSVRSQACFSVIVWTPHLQITLPVQKGMGTPFPPHYTPGYNMLSLKLEVPSFSHWKKGINKRNSKQEKTRRLGTRRCFRHKTKKPFPEHRVASNTLLRAAHAFTRRDSSQTDAEGVVSPVATIAEHHEVFAVRHAANCARLALHALPVVGLDHWHELVGHFQACRMS